MDKPANSNGVATARDIKTIRAFALQLRRWYRQCQRDSSYTDDEGAKVWDSEVAWNMLAGCIISNGLPVAREAGCTSADPLPADGENKELADLRLLVTTLREQLERCTCPAPEYAHQPHDTNCPQALQGVPRQEQVEQKSDPRVDKSSFTNSPSGNDRDEHGS